VIAMRIQLALLIAVIPIGSNQNRSGAGRSESAHLVRQGVPDTMSYVERSDLQILDTIHFPSTLARQPTELSVFRLGGDTIVEVRVLVDPLFLQRSAISGSGRNVGMGIQIGVFARDTTVGFLHQYSLAFARCPVDLKLFRTPARTGRPVWSSHSERDTLSCPNLKSSGDVERSISWPVHEILGDSLPAGQYFFTVGLRLADGRAFNWTNDSSFLTGYSTPPTDDPSAITFHGSSVVEGAGPRMLRTRAIAVNSSNRPVEMYFGSCALTVSLFSTSPRSTVPVWQSALREPRERPNVGHSGYGCTMELRTRILQPADSNVFELGVPLAEILADSLTFGRYRVTASTVLESRKPGLPATTRHLDLGEVSIRSAPDSLPRSRTLNGLRYTAAARVIRGDMSGDIVRTMVLVTNDTPAPKTDELFPGCPVIAYAFRSTAERDSLPLGRAAWAAVTGCRFTVRRFMLERGQRQIFFMDRPLADKGITPGRYFVVAWFGGKSNALLNAGSVVIDP
jgi:hypothetical protein